MHLPQLLLPLLLPLLTTSLPQPPSHPPSLSFSTTIATIQIQQTLALWPLAVDSKNYTLLPLIFTPTAFLGSPPPTGNFIGIPSITAFLTLFLNNTLTQHSYGTQYIDVDIERGTASAATYLIASFVGTGPSNAGEYLVNRAKYEDELVEGEGGWRVVNRTLVYMVPTVGNLTA
ncbi:hypothetical protein JMJ35_003506 [Cladonia borealis]|uniref:SnoaL-like domain-containing protein n=1 Tax=Cladonia borealis TaxID=184061 RepID=A0AA39R523_9LECA|nr:hypothetical protein JMJ35_003506 [Cladonia borealis]